MNLINNVYVVLNLCFNVHWFCVQTRKCVYSIHFCVLLFADVNIKLSDFFFSFSFLSFFND